jgi:hypothetical protein
MGKANEGKSVYKLEYFPLALTIGFQVIEISQLDLNHAKNLADSNCTPFHSTPLPVFSTQCHPLRAEQCPCICVML